MTFLREIVCVVWIVDVNEKEEKLVDSLVFGMLSLFVA